MNLFPAIDLYNQEAVRLLKGSFKNITVYDKDPVKLAKTFEAKGVKRIHVIDLNGAKNESTLNDAVIELMVSELSIPIQIGGGIRTLEKAEKLLSMGVDRIIIGSMAIRDEDSLKKLIETYGKRICVGIDAYNGQVATNGWATHEDVNSFDFASKMVHLGVKTIIYTDIAKDGTLSGIDASLYKALSSLDVNVIASGGVASIEDIKALNCLPIEGIITGKAIYEGRLDIEEALSCLQNE
jgi:phosphoribosylformimino-5-aminoimidazole carboxamide ribotide isomerase